MINFEKFILALSLALSVSFSAAGTVSYSQNNSNDQIESGESGEEIMAREQFILMRRAGGPDKVLPPNAYSNALIQKMQIIEDRFIPNSPTRLTSWVSVNPTGLFYQVTNNNYISGRTNSIAFHPTDPNILYIAAAQGGVWKTTNGGVNWVPLTDNLTTLASGDIQVDQANPNILYLGTGELNYSGDSQYGDGIFKSTNAGASWVQVAAGSLVGTRCSQISIDPTNSNVVYMAGSSGVFKSTNAGTNWVNTNSGTNANCIFIDPTNTQILFAATGGSGAGLIKKSTDGGTTWNTLAGGLPGGMGRVQLAPAPSNHLVIYASIAVPGGALLGLYLTTDGGTTWTLQASSANYTSQQGWYDNAVTVNTTNASLVVVGGLDCYSSSTSGTGLVQRSSWSTGTATNMTHADIHRLRYRGTVLYCCSDGGVYKSTNDGVAWTDLNSTISTLQFESADYDPSNTMNIHGGTQDNNKEYTNNGGTSWIQRTTGDGGYTVIDPVNVNYIYGEYVQGSVQRSANSGTSYTNITPNGSTGGLFYDPYEMAPGDHNTIVFGRADLWKTTNAQTVSQASGWTQIGTTAQIGGSVSAIGISWTNTNKIYVGTSNGRILVTTDNGTTWQVTTGNPYVSDFAVDNTNDNVCYASLTGAGATHVLKTTNAGVNWVSVTGNLPSIACNSLILRTAAPRMLFAGTDLGVYQSTNDGVSWVAFNTGFPNVQVYDMKYKQANGLLLAATHGRGCWIYDIGSITGVDPYSVIPKNYELNQNFPNPFNPSTQIKFGLPNSADVKLSVFDISGRKVASLINNRLNAGTFEVHWDASQTASGIYFYTLIAGDYKETKKMILLK